MGVLPVALPVCCRMGCIVYSTSVRVFLSSPHVQKPWLRQANSKRCSCEDSTGEHNNNNNALAYGLQPASQQQVSREPGATRLRRLGPLVVRLYRTADCLECIRPTAVVLTELPVPCCCCCCCCLTARPFVQVLTACKCQHG